MSTWICPYNAQFQHNRGNQQTVTGNNKEVLVLNVFQNPINNYESNNYFSSVFYDNFNGTDYIASGFENYNHTQPIGKDIGAYYVSVEGNWNTIECRSGNSSPPFTHSLPATCEYESCNLSRPLTEFKNKQPSKKKSWYFFYLF